MKKLLSWVLLVVLCSMSQASDFNRVPAGLIKGARQSWVSDSTIKIGVGYGEIMGNYWEIGPDDPLATTGYALTGLTTTANGIVQYLYIDRVNSSLPKVTIRNSSAAPLWSDEFMGWYNGSDRCIGAVWIESIGVVRYFYSPDDTTYAWNAVTKLIPGSIPTNYDIYSTCNISIYAPVNASYLRCSASVYSSTEPWSNCRVCILPEKGLGDTQDGVMRAVTTVWLPFERGMEKKVKWMAYAMNQSGNLTSTGSLYIAISGYQLER